jgi:hypothetical protein
MQGYENDKFIFYTAGKIGTRTLLHTEGMTDFTSPWENTADSLRRRTLSMVLDQKEITGKKIIILIREPVSRFYSGMFELAGKILSGPYIRQILSQGGDISFLNDPSFWKQYNEPFLRFSSKAWSPHKEFESHRWQYHIGNWLHDAEAVSEIHPDSIILNIKDLSSFFISNGIPDSHTNKYTNIVPDEYEYDTKPIFNAFIQGLEMLTQRMAQFGTYLAPEKECYERLINSQQYYKVE